VSAINAASGSSPEGAEGGKSQTMPAAGSSSEAGKGKKGFTMGFGRKK